MSKRDLTVVRLPETSGLSPEDCRLLVDSVHDYAIFMLDVEGRVVTWNPGAEQIKGYRASEIVGQHFSKFYPAEDVTAGKPAWELETAAALGRVEDEGWRIRKDGSRFWANVVISALRDSTGVLRGFGKVTRDLTARKAAEEQLRASEQRFHHLVDAVIDYAIYSLDLAGTITTWNAGAQRLKGYAAHEILGKHFSVFYTPEDLAEGKPERILGIVRREGRYEEEGWRVRKDGTRFWANVIVTAQRNDEGELRGFAKVTRDLSARREAEATERTLLKEQAARAAAEDAQRLLRDSENRYRELSQRLEIILSGVADGITVQGVSGRLVFANQAAARLWGFERAEDFVRTAPEVFAEQYDFLDDQDRVVPIMELPGRKIFAGHEAASALLRIRERRTRREWWTNVRAAAVRGEDPKADLAVAIWHDVTAVRRQELQQKYLADASAALASSLRSEAMLAAFAQALVPALADGCTIHLLDEKELRNVASVYADSLRLPRAPVEPSVLALLSNVARTGESVLHNDDFRDDDVASAAGPRTLLLVPILIRERPAGVLGLDTAKSRRRYDESDVALAKELGRRAGAALENSRLYEAAQESARDAEAASRTKDEFLTIVSHELRTPLTAIVGWASILKAKSTDETVAKAIEVIHRNARAQVKIIDDILDVARVVTGKFKLEVKPFDFLSVVRDAIEVVRPSAAAKKIDLELTPDSQFCALVGDPERLQQVVWNLLSNAVKFTDEGGKIRISVRHDGANMTLSVADTGRGIAPDFLPYVFDRFKQADGSTTRRKGGLGLGLAIVRHIVELHGGNVAVSSEGLGTGSTFSMTVPLSAVIPPDMDVPSSARASTTTPAQGGALQGVRVVLVDDDDDARDLVGVVLSDAGAIVEAASSAAEGIELLAARRPDVLVSDIGMPDEDGYSFIRHLRARGPGSVGNIPALALSAFASEEDKQRALVAGFTRHLAKPVDPDALVAIVADLVASSRR